MKNFCNVCMKRENIEMSEVQENVNVKGMEFSAKLKVPKCVVCGNEIFVKEIERENDNVVYNEYKRNFKLLTSNEIKDIRLSLGLSQKSFAKILGFGEKTITRYENGSIQDVSHDNLMRLFSKKMNVQSIWEIRKEKLTKRENEVLSFAFSPEPDLSFVYKLGKSPFVSYESIEALDNVCGDNYEC